METRTMINHSTKTTDWPGTPTSADSKKSSHSTKATAHCPSVPPGPSFLIGRFDHEYQRDQLTPPDNEDITMINRSTTRRDIITGNGKFHKDLQDHRTPSKCRRGRARHTRAFAAVIALATVVFTVTGISPASATGPVRTVYGETGNVIGGAFFLDSIVVCGGAGALSVFVGGQSDISGYPQRFAYARVVITPRGEWKPVYDTWFQVTNWGFRISNGYTFTSHGYWTVYLQYAVWTGAEYVYGWETFQVYTQYPVAENYPYISSTCYI